MGAFFFQNYLTYLGKVLNPDTSKRRRREGAHCKGKGCPVPKVPGKGKKDTAPGVPT